jgi:hypothetical protein
MCYMKSLFIHSVTTISISSSDNNLLWGPPLRESPGGTHRGGSPIRIRIRTCSNPRFVFGFELKFEYEFEHSTLVQNIGFWCWKHNDSLWCWNTLFVMLKRRDSVGSVALVLDLYITHERWGSNSNPSRNGQLYYQPLVDIDNNEWSHCRKDTWLLYGF